MRTAAAPAMYDSAQSTGDIVGVKARHNNPGFSLARARLQPLAHQRRK